MPNGKAAGVRCIQLSASERCLIFGLPERPACCAGLAPAPDMCGTSRSAALLWLTQLELATAPVTITVRGQL